MTPDPIHFGFGVIFLLCSFGTSGTFCNIFLSQNPLLVCQDGRGFSWYLEAWKNPPVLPGEEKRAERQKEGGLYAIPVNVKTLLKTIPQHRKNAMTRSRVAVRVMR